MEHQIAEQSGHDIAPGSDRPARDLHRTDDQHLDRGARRIDGGYRISQHRYGRSRPGQHRCGHLDVIGPVGGGRCLLRAHRCGLLVAVDVHCSGRWASRQGQRDGRCRQCRWTQWPIGSCTVPGRQQADPSAPIDERTTDRRYEHDGQGDPEEWVATVQNRCRTRSGGEPAGIVGGTGAVTQVGVGW